MKVLVVGSLPPPERPRSERLRAAVAGLLAEGHTIEVVAVDPIATAHRYLAAGGVPACLQLLTIMPRFDAVVVQLQPGLPVRAKARGFERALSLGVFALALGRGGEVELRLDSLDDFPGGPGGPAAGRIWRRAGRIVLGDEEQLARFLAALGRRGESLALSSSPEIVRADDDGGWGEGADASVEDVLALVRKRAARERRALSSTDAPHFAGWDQLAAPGIAMTEADAAVLGAPDGSRKPADLARRLLAAADRRPSLWRFARAARLARRGVYALARPGRG
jgi:hypothetical protein